MSLGQRRQVRIRLTAPKTAMIKAASRVYLVAGSTKINTSSFTRLGSLETIHAFFTDRGKSEADAAAFRARSIEMLVA